MEISSSSQRFGCILRDRNQNAFVCKKNLKAPVKDRHHHHHELFKSHVSDENSENLVDSWIEALNKKNNTNNGIVRLTGKPTVRKSRVISASPPIEESVSRKEKCNESKRNNGASSLVQIWEARLNPSSGGNSPSHNQSTVASSIRGDSGVSVQDSCFSESPSDESEAENGHVEMDSGRVADLIRRLSNEKKLIAGGGGGLSIIRTPRPYVSSCSSSDKSSFPMVSHSPRLRGRQAFTDLLMRMERDRHRELDWLLERNAVSKFPQRGRLQSMLRLRSLKRGLVIQDRHRSSPKSPDLNRLQPCSTVLHLRERFRGNAASSREKLSRQKRKIKEAMLLKKETVSNLSYLEPQETIVPEALIRESDDTSPRSSVTHQESQILDNTVESGCQGSQETPFLEKQETSYGWEEQEEYEKEQSCYGEMSYYDWFTDISRPRTYWEDLRKSRYLEVMNSRSDKDDLCRLIERRTVSDFLQSGLREKIDKLIMSRVQTHSVQLIDKAGKEEQNCDIGDEVEDDDLSQTPSQLFASSPAGSWSSQDTGVTSTPDLLLPLHNLQTTEVEIISEMRSQILQLQLEMSELRDSVKTCLDVNASLQKSVHRENPLKQKCCVCNEMQVETLLYRCGHMCTCLRCANELQCNGGKCPICYAKILDVVRVFVDSRT